MKTDYKYIAFLHVSSKTKTTVWNCVNVRSGEELGRVSWYPSWRRYCYFPAVKAVYSAGCLKDIIEFIDALMEDRKC